MFLAWSRGCRYYRLPKTNVDFWRHKIATNTARDHANSVDLRLAGWRVIRVWECEIRTKAKREETLERLYTLITCPSAIEPNYAVDIEDGQMAAEPEAPYGG